MSGADAIRVSAVAVDVDTIYAVDQKYRVVSQPVCLMSEKSDWTVASYPGVKSLAVIGEAIYGVSLKNVLVRQNMAHMTPHSSWDYNTGLAGINVSTSVAIAGNKVYTVNVDTEVVS